MYPNPLHHDSSMLPPDPSTLINHHHHVDDLDSDLYIPTMFAV